MSDPLRSARVDGEGSQRAINRALDHEPAAVSDHAGLSARNLAATRVVSAGWQNLSDVWACGRQADRRCSTVSRQDTRPRNPLAGPRSRCLGISNGFERLGDSRPASERRGSVALSRCKRTAALQTHLTPVRAGPV